MVKTNEEAAGQRGGTQKASEGSFDGATGKWIGPTVPVEVRVLGPDDDTMITAASPASESLLMVVVAPTLSYALVWLALVPGTCRATTARSLASRR